MYIMVDGIYNCVINLYCAIIDLGFQLTYEYSFPP